MKTFRIYLAAMALAFVSLLGLNVNLARADSVQCVPYQLYVSQVKATGAIVIWSGMGRSGETYAIIVLLKSMSADWAAVVIPADMSKACFVAQGKQNKILQVGA